VSRHVKPHRWADLMAGRIEPAERSAMEAHAKTCARCEAARVRVGRASDSFPSIRDHPAPQLPWDSVRARVHWSVSKERREKQGVPEKPRVPMLAWAAMVAVAAGGVGLVSGSVTQSPDVEDDTIARDVPQPAPAKAPLVPVKAPPAALAGLINRISAGELMIDGARPTDPFATRIVAGTVIATGDGGVDVQFGDASAFALGPHSTLDIQRFDAEVIELVVEGTIDIEVAPRAPGQRFTVIAGEHAIEVRGTQFRVSHEPSSTTVACRHGLVAVADRAPKAGAPTALVGAARRVKVATGAAIADARVVPLSVDELASFAQTTPLRVPLWDSDTLISASAPLAIGGTGGRDVRVDGIEVGAAPLLVRVMPGRHTVESTDAAGRYRRAGWVDVAAPAPGAKPAHLDIPAEPAPGAATAAVGQRRAQLRAGIDKARLHVCMRRLAKAGLTGTYVQIEISVDGGGAVGFLNVLDTDLPSEPAGCVREVLADVRFRPGAAATWREKIDL
jgi:hypothetical protein